MYQTVMCVFRDPVLVKSQCPLKRMMREAANWRMSRVSKVTLMEAL